MSRGSKELPLPWGGWAGQGDLEGMPEMTVDQ